jgi:hypothetical protein
MGILRFVKHRGTGELLHVYRVKDWEEIKAIDLALIRCPELASEIVHMPMSFEPLDVFDEVSAVGYPFSMDAERLVVVHRGFAGHVVTRREMFHIPGQPPGYELSFRAPRGLSGAPLVARHADGGTYCHGVVVQDMGIDIDQVGGLHVGIAVAADALLSVTTSFSSTGYLATLLGRAFVPRRAPTPVRNPNMVAHEASEDGWPTGDHE